MEGKLVVGVDGGATKTHLAVADESGQLLAVHESGGTYYVLDDALTEMALLLQPISNSTVSVAVFTVSGWDFETDQLQQKAIIEEALLVNNITVERAVYENDIFSTYQSAKDVKGAAVVISCGTGIIGLAANNGKYYKTPGYEYLSGEWGSGIHQAEYAIHLACASMLGREADYPILISKALAYFGATDLDTLAHSIANVFVSNRQRGYFLKHVYEAFYEGCPGAAKVVNRAADELAKTAWCLLKKINTDDVSLVFGGGVIDNFGIPPTFKACLYSLTGNYYQTYIVKNLPVYGALKWALNIAGADTRQIDDLLITEVTESN